MKTIQLKKTLIWSLSIIFLIFVVMIIHILLVTKPQVYDNNNIQLVKIDFAKDSATLGIKEVIHDLKNTTGIKTVNFFPEQYSLVASYDNNYLDNSKIMNQIHLNTTVTANLFTPSEEMLSNACPINKETFAFKFSMFIKNVFY